jgi:hypothetical protein
MNADLSAGECARNLTLGHITESFESPQRKLPTTLSFLKLYFIIVSRMC